jgi:hypothetical protein
MKLLKTSLLLAAAATQLEAANYQATWSGAGGTATATIVADDVLFGGGNSMTSSSAWITSFNMTVTNTISKF